MTRMRVVVESTLDKVRKYHEDQWLAMGESLYGKTEATGFIIYAGNNKRIAEYVRDANNVFKRIS